MLLNWGFDLVLLMRLAGPLLILRFPLAGSLLSEFVFDALDVVIWDFSGVLASLDYTLWDKSFDVYQITLQAFIVLTRWTRPIPKRIALGLFAMRIFAFAAYQFTHVRLLYFIFPNLFVLFFIAYLLCQKFGKAHWFEKPASLAVILLVLLALKMPQEYVLHYLEIPTWKVIKDFLF